MKTYRVCFLSWHFRTPELFLQTLLKMTPGRLGRWENITAVTDPFQADFCCVFDGYSGPLPEERVIYFGQHPQCCDKSFRRWEDKKALLRLPLDKYLNPGEWWLDYDYDTLRAMEIPPKSKKAICVMTYQTHIPMYAQRPWFMRRFFEKYNDIDLFGRPQERFMTDSVLSSHYKGFLGHNQPDGTLGEHMFGKELLIDYKYSLEFDVGPTVNYFSERVYDALLLWCMPIYFGSINLSKFLPRDSFWQFDAFNFEDVELVEEAINSNDWEENRKDIAEARELLLNRYQTWPYVAEVINNLDKYLNEQKGG